MKPASHHSNARVQLEAVSLRYPAAQGNTLSNVAFELVHDGSAIAIVGPSGSGKSSFLSLLGGLIRPTTGKVVAHSRLGQPCVPLDVVSWVFQTTNSLPRRSVRDNAALAAFAVLPRTEALAAASICLERVGLGAIQQRQARHLSGGELQRLGVARALASDAPFMILDEPTGQLDSLTSETVLDAVFAQHEVSRVRATHDTKVMERCDVVYHLDAGRIVRH